ncbi:hypothetical protein D3C78_1153470 [compost metagenome]
MVGADHIQAPAEQRLAQGVAVGAALDRRVALDQVAERGVVAVVEIQVMGADLGGDPLAGQRAGLEQAQLAGGGDVQHMQLGREAPGQAHRQAGGAPAGFGVADQRVLVGGNLVAIARPPLRLAFADARGVLAVGEQHGRAVAEQPLQRGQVVDQHVAGGGAHEHLDRRDPLRCERGDGVQVAVADAEVEAVVDLRAGRGAALLGFQRRQGQGRRVGVGHVHHAGDAAGHGGARFAGEAALVRRAGVAEMHLIVDQAGQQELAGGVDLAGGGAFDAAGDLVDAAVADQQVGVELMPFVDQTGIADQQAFHGASASSRRSTFCRYMPR